MQQTGASPLSINGRRAYMEIFISEPVLSISFRYLMLAPSSSEPSNQRANSRSGSLLTLEEISPWTSLKARELSLGPSDAPCLGEASTAHADYFFSVKLIHLKTVMASQASAPAPDHTHMLCSMNLLIPELTPSPPSFSSDLTSRRSLSDPCPNAGKLGFCLEGFEPTFGPLPIQRPRPIPSDPCLNNIKPKSISLCILSICSQKLGRSLHLNGRRHHLREESPSLLWSFNYTLRTLDLVLNLAKSYDSKSWKVYSLLFPIPSCWRIVCSYRSSVPKCSPLATFAKDFKHRLNVISNKLKIMCSSPPPDLEDSSSDFEIVLKRSFTVALPCLQPLLPDRNSPLAPSVTSRCLLTVTISPSFDSFMEARSTNRDLTCVQMLSSFGFKALIEPSSIYSSYLLVVLGYAPL